MFSVTYVGVNAGTDEGGIPELMEKTLSTISITTDKAFAFLKDAGDDKFTLTHPIEVKGGVTLYLCTNGIDILFASASKIFGEGTVYLCNCREYPVGTPIVSTIRAEKNIYYLDQFGIKWPATMSRIINREDPLISARNVNIYGTDTANICNLVFDDIEIRNNFRNNICKEYMKDDYTIANWSMSHAYGSVITAKYSLNMYDVIFKNCIATRSNGIVNTGNGTSYIVGCGFINNMVTENGGAICMNTTNGGSLYVGDSKFEDNEASGNGGAIYVPSAKDVELKIDKCTFEGNTAGTYGGAICYDGERTTINSSVFKRNKSGSTGGALAFINSAAAYTGVSNKEINIGKHNIDDTAEANTLFEENESGQYGGAIGFNTSYFSEKEIRQGMQIVANLNAIDFKTNKAIGIKGTYEGNDYYFNSFGGAIYSKGHVTLNIGD